jgi:hypothetical protein
MVDRGARFTDGSGILDLEQGGSLSARFLHKHYCLHVSALLAVAGANRVGATLLLGSGAIVDAVREQLIVYPILRNTEVGGELDIRGQWTYRQTLIAWLLMLAGLAGLFLAAFSVVSGDAAVSWVSATFLRPENGIIPVLPPHYPMVDEHSRMARALYAHRLEFISSVSFAFVLISAYVVTWKSTMIAVSAGTKGRIFIIASPSTTTFIHLVTIFVIYYFGTVFSIRQFMTSSATSLDTKLIELHWIFVAFLSLAVWSYYSILTAMRLGRPTRKQSSEE